MQRTNIRIGNNVYEKLYGSFGLTTLKDKHVKVKGQKIFFLKEERCHASNRPQESKAGKAYSEMQGYSRKELFQYFDDEGNRHSVDSGMVNDYIKEISGEDFTAKDFRTWSGTVSALIAFKEIGYAENDTEYKKRRLKKPRISWQKTGKYIGCLQKYYVHPLVINLYENNSIKNILMNWKS